MTRTLPPRNRADRVVAQRRAPRFARAVPGVGGLVGGTEVNSEGKQPSGPVKPDRAASINMQLAQKCLMLISEFTYRCASSWDPVCFGYALQELGYKIVEREGVSDIWLIFKIGFSKVPPQSYRRSVEEVLVD